MEKKLLFLTLLLLAYLLPTSGIAQSCPTSVSVNVNPGTTICSGTSVTFTATPNGGSGYLYQWQKGGVDISGATSATYSSNTLSNSDEIRVVIKSSAANSTCSTTSSELSMTVNPVLTPSVSISASKTTICPGENITFTASPVNGGTNPSYVWKVGSSIQSSTTSTFSTTSLTNGQSVTVELTSNATCASTTPVTSSPVAITVKSGTPETPGTVTGATDVCPIISGITYSVASDANATEYVWSLPNGWSGSSTTNSITVTSGTTGTGTISVQAKNDCGTSAASNPLLVTVKPGTPSTPGNITGDAQVCPGISKTYSVPNVTGVTYAWTYPTGWSGTSSTNSITLTSGGTGQNGQIAVTANNSCGTSSSSTIAVSVKAGIPASPSTVNGAAVICPGLSEIYTLPAVAGATEYLWTLPTGFSASNLTTTTPSLTVTAGASGSGNISVLAKNSCGESLPKTIAVSISNPAPVMSGSITQPTNGVCANTSGHVYSIPAITNATSYVWSVPSGWNITGGAGTRSITFSSGSSGGNISVTAKNSCGESSAKTIAVVLNNPPPVMTGEISGPLNVCAITAGNEFSIPAATNATGYTWAVPSGWNITAGAGTRSITVTSGTSGGNITLSASNSCGNVSKTIAVTTTSGPPVQPGAITVTNLPNSAICPPATGIGFSVAGVSGLTYNWILPPGFEITSGAGTRSIMVNVTATTAYSNSLKVEVKAMNVCGQSSARIYEPISVGNFVVTNAGPDQTVCSVISPINILGDYNFSGSNKNLSTQWTSSNGGSFGNSSKLETTYTPSQAAINAGKTTLTLTTAAPSGACGPGKDEMIIFFKPDPTASISGTSTICTGNATDITFSGTPNTIVTYEKNGVEDQIAIGANGTKTLNTGALTANTTTYTLVSVRYTAAPNCLKTVSGSAAITVTPKPTVSLSYTGTPFCTSLNTPQPASLAGTNAYTGGKYSSTTGLTIDENSGAITPSSSTAGTYTVTYETLASGGCEKVSTTTQVVITKLPTAAISYTGSPFCGSNTSEIPVNLSGTDLYLDGLFSAPAGLSINATTGKVTPSLSTPGEYIVKYETPSTNGCAKVSTTTNIVIDAAPTVTIGYADSPVCISNSNGNAVTITGTGDYLGGIFSAPSGLTINASSGTINASTSTPGTYKVSYKTSSVKCQEVEATTDVTITEIPSVEISYNTPSCNNAGVIPVTFANGIGAFEGGTFSATPGGLNIDPESGEINSNTSTPIEYTVKYLIKGTGGCSDVEITTNVTITQLPQVTITYPQEICSSETEVLVVLAVDAGAGSDGVFSGTAGLDISEYGTINPSTSTTGPHTVEYTIASEAGCDEVVATADFTIKKAPFISTEPVNTGTCSNSPAQFEVVASGDNLIYQWYRIIAKEPQSLEGEDEAILSFTNATSADAGEYYVVVSGAGSCSEDTSITVTLNVDEDIVITEPSEDVTICEDSKEKIEFLFKAHAKGAPLTFQWIKDGTPVTEITNKIEMMVSDPQGDLGEYTGTLTIYDPESGANGDSGEYAVNVYGPDYFTCSEGTSKTFTFRVEPRPGAPSVSNDEFCLNEIAGNLTAAGEEGNIIRWYTYDENTSEYTYKKDNIAIDTSEPNTFIYYATQTRTNGCESDFSAPLTISVLDKPDLVSAETIEFEFCHNEEVSEALSITPSNGATLNWYDVSEGGTVLSSAPTPVTSEVKVTSYWISQTLTSTGCESDRTEVKIIINALPNLSIVVADSGSQNICLGSEINLVASGATNYIWTLGENEVGTSATLTHEPTNTGVNTYILRGVDDNGCANITEIDIQVEEPSNAGNLMGPSSVCTGENTGTLTVSDYLGDIVRWESSTDGTNWTAIAETTFEYSFQNLNTDTSFRSVVKNGVCEEAFSAALNVVIDPLPVAGNILFKGTDRVFMMCEFPTADYLVPLQTTGTYVGEIISWQYRRSSVSDWTVITNNDGTNFTDTTLSGQQVNAASNNESTLFRVEVQSGACSPNVYSDYATLSIIPSDIAPNPVTITREAICLSESIELSSGTGYGGYGVFMGGAFDNSSIANHGWRVKIFDSDTEYTFESAANNIRPDRWQRTNPKEFMMTGSSGNISQLFDSSSGDEGNKGFAIVSGNNPSTLETPVFNTFTMDNPELTFDQAYNLTAGDVIRVEISLDGGVTYESIPLMEITGPATSGYYDSFGDGNPVSRPNNKISIPLDQYVGLPNLRIRWLYDGSTGGIYAIDAIGVPQDPNNVELIWYYDEDPDDPNVELEKIGEVNQGNVSFTPTKIGWNYFEVQTALVFDTNGDPCTSAKNMATIRVYVFDQYTSTATAAGGTCGAIEVQLEGIIEGAHQGIIDDFPTLDGYEASWDITGPSGYDFSPSHLIDQDGNINAINDPNAIFKPGFAGDYTITWKMTPTTKDINGDLIVNDGCPPVHKPVTFDIDECTTLDFDGVDDYVDLGTTYTKTYSIEAWIQPFDRSDNLNASTTDASEGTIISGPNFEVKMEDLPATVTPNNRWYHVAVSDGRLYIDGIDSGTSGLGTGGDNTLIGARWNNISGEPENYFSGWIEEVRIWNTAITQEQIQFMMNQHLIDNGAQMGEQIPMPVPGGLTYANLEGYYRLISKVPDPDPITSLIVTFPPALKPLNGFTPDLTGKYDLGGRLVNMTTNQQNTAPLPYISANPGNWNTPATWLRTDVWDIPNSDGVNEDPIDWNIVRINHDIDSGDRDITVLGLKSETQDKLLEISGPGTKDEYNSGHMLRVTHYLLLDGNIDLVGESQLLQDSGSILDAASAGYLERDQQGKRNSFVYNYWSSPVSLKGPGANNAPYNVKSVLMDGTIPSAPTTINFRPGYWEADWARTNPIIISTYWLWGYSPAEADIYANWDWIHENGTLKTGEGFTMKGTDGTASIGDEQNYTFRGKPHNGDFNLNIGANQNYLIGNPYPSAMDADEFIRNNIEDGGDNGTNVFDGALYFWDHFQEVDHYLIEYIGGYATYNFIGGVPAISDDYRINANDAKGSKYPGQYIPVAQAFLINSSDVNAPGVNVTGGDIHFKNSQRFFEREQVDDSQFLKPEVNTKTNKEKTQEKSKIRISFKSPIGYYRQILVGAIPSATNGFDLGYDAFLFDDNVEDMYWLQADNQLVIQGVSNFDKDQVLPLGVKIKENKEFRIRIDTLENAPSEMNIYLNDKLKDSVHDLKAGAYFSTSEPGYIHDRFEIIFFKEEPPVIEGPIIGEPQPEVPIIEDPQTDFTTLSIKHAHDLREIQILNPDRLIITSVYLFDLNGNLIENYTNIPHNQEINLRVKNYSSGVYLLKVYAEGKIISKKIIISN